MIAVLTLVFAFRSSAALAYAYGMAVTGTMTITTLLFLYYSHRRWRWPLWAVIGGGGLLLIIDLLFFAANLTKLRHGAWLPLLIALLAFTVLTTWARGRRLVTATRTKTEGPLQQFIDEIVQADPPLTRMPGTAVFLNRGDQTAPLAMRANVEHNHVLHQQVVIMALQTEDVPRVPESERITLDDLGYHDDGIVHVTAHFGYMERPDVPNTLRRLSKTDTEGQIDVDTASYFLSKVDLCAGPEKTMPAWRKQLFIATSYITADAAGYFNLPWDRTIIIGARMQI
jgi:KUP system potassium uptake protein